MFLHDVVAAERRRERETRKANVQNNSLVS